MLTSVLLHIIAAVLWCIALISAMGVGSNHAKGNTKESNAGLVILLFLSVIAFILQVIA